MTENNTHEIFIEALHIKDPWYLTEIKFQDNKLIIEVDFKRGAMFEDDDNGNDVAKMYKVYDTKPKTWRHLNFFQFECFIKARTPRIQRDDGRVRLITPPWSGVMNGFTLLFEALIISLVKEMPVSKLAMFLGTYSGKIWKMLELYTLGAQMDEDYSNVKVIGIDETSVSRGHDYISLFVDLHKKRTIFVADGKSSNTVLDFSRELADHNASPDQITETSCDMSPAFIKGINEQLPNAQITFDKFHISKIINNGVDEVRRIEARNNPLLKNSRYVFLKNDENLTKKQRTKKDELKISKINLKSLKALQMRENFQQIYKAKTVDDFTFLLEKWYSWVIRSRLIPMKKVAKTIKHHWEGIIRWKASQINNGILEGLNSVLQAAKRKARGYGREHFKTMAYLLTGKLDFSKVNKLCSTHSFL